MRRIRQWLTALARAELLVAALAAIVVFSVPLAVRSAMAEPVSEVKVVGMDGRLSAYVVTDQVRLLTLNVRDPRDAQALLGRIRQPWEPGPSVLVVSAANDERAVGVWTAMNQTQPSQIIVVGLPGADPAWTALERSCTERGIHLDYVAERSTVEVGELELIVQRGDDATGDALILRSGQTNIAIALDGGFPDGSSSVVVANGEPARNARPPSLIVRTDVYDSLGAGSTQLVTGRNGTVTLLLEDERIRIRGGSLQSPPSATLGP